ncbi:DsbA family protein [Spirulina major]|uniref:DsbA family protein n=1 Tax=Spirulina major TaxID=270636 RepID=UPI00158774E4|nr:DsbA family protein [Spirulina major]
MVAALALLVWSCALPAQANANFERQVLEVIQQHPEAIMESVQNYKRQQREQIQATQEAFAQDLITQPDGIVGSSPRTGDLENRAILLEFSDFQCPFCAKAHDTIKTFVAQHSDQVTLVYKHLPLASIHSQAIPAAKAAYAAQQQGQFWEFHDALFQNQDQLGEEFYLKTARQLHLNLEQFERDRANAMEIISEDTNLATQMKINGTPFFMFQGQVFSGAVPIEKFENLL